MSKSFINTYILRIFYPFIWVILTIIQIFLLSYYLSAGYFSKEYFYYDAIVINILQAAILLTLWYPLKFYSKIVTIPLLILFHFLVFIIYSAIYIGLGFLITNSILLHYPYYSEFFMMILPIRIVFGLLIYIVFVLTCYLLLFRNELETQKHKKEEQLATNSTIPIEKLSRVVVKKNSEYHCINVNQINYIEANGDYVMIYTGSNKYLKDQTMKYWETHLPDDYFVRIHRSFIVNIEVIARIELYEKEIYKVHLKNGDALKASSAGYKLLKQKMRL